MSDISLIYDGECPACAAYVRLLRLRAAAGTLTLIDARQAPERVAQLRLQGFEINQGMVLEVGQARYAGAQALHMLALMASPANFLNRVMIWLFSNEARARFTYPLLAAGRKILLSILGKQPVA